MSQLTMGSCSNASQSLECVGNSPIVFTFHNARAKSRPWQMTNTAFCGSNSSEDVEVREALSARGEEDIVWYGRNALSHS